MRHRDLFLNRLIDKQMIMETIAFINICDMRIPVLIWYDKW
jgi:hypothetical protein